MLTTSLGRLLLFTYTPREIHATTLHGDLVAYLFENCYRTKQALSGKSFFFFFCFISQQKNIIRDLSTDIAEREKKCSCLPYQRDKLIFYLSISYI